MRKITLLLSCFFIFSNIVYAGVTASDEDKVEALLLSVYEGLINPRLFT